MISDLVYRLREYHHMLCDMGFPHDEDADLIAEAADTIEELSAKLDNGGWIPCSEKPPKELCIYTIEDYSPYTVAKYGKSQRKLLKTLPLGLDMYERIIAWKPIDPEPYKGE